MIITELNGNDRIRLNIRSLRHRITHLKTEIKRSRGSRRDYLYTMLDETCEQLNRMQRKSCRTGVTV